MKIFTERFPSAEQTKMLVHAYFQGVLSADLSVCEEMLSDDYIDHDAPPGTPPGPTGAKEYVAELLQTYRDLSIQVEDIIAEGYKVAARVIWRGRHKETGTPWSQMSLIILHLNHTGQFVERWSAYTPV